MTSIWYKKPEWNDWVVINVPRADRARTIAELKKLGYQVQE